ncbi:hypothetical protein DFH29DRAFT_896045, partial [Suillus ampliporus]
MLLRWIQATGSTSTVALGAVVIGDISAPAERGGFFGLLTMGPQVGPAVGPNIGGVLADTLGWRFLPSKVQTLRQLAGDGSVIPSPFYRPLVPLVGKGRPPKRLLNNPLRLFFYLNVPILLVFNAIIYAVFYAVNTTISTGLIFDTVLSIRMVDADYQRVKTRLWSLQREANIAIPLILQIICASLNLGLPHTLTRVDEHLVIHSPLSRTLCRHYSLIYYHRRVLPLPRV